MMPETCNAEARAKLIDVLAWLEQCEAFMREVTTDARGYDGLEVETLPTDYDLIDPTRFSYRNIDRLMRGFRGKAREVREILAAVADPLQSNPTPDTSMGGRMERLGLRVIDGGQRDQSDHAA